MPETIHPQKAPRELRFVCAAGLVAWCAATAGGFFLLMRYDNTPGPAARSPAAWPADSRIRPDGKRPCLVVALHPRCPCSRATVAELEELMRSCGDRLESHVFFYAPEGAGAEWADTDLWDSAASIPGVTVWCDGGGAEGRHFGAVTSGHAVLYSAGGELIFCGGLTPARGQTGDNTDRGAILAHVRGKESGVERAAVFGCPLRESSSGEVTGVSECKRNQ
jgi:hypothetical protein